MSLLRFISPVACLGVMLAVAPLAHADTVTGSVYEGATSYPFTFAPSTPTVPLTATFTVTNPGSTDFNFVGNSPSSYTLGGFLASGGGTVNFLTGGGASTDSINNDVFEFTGTTTLVSGDTYTITHDDGMYLYVNGALVISSGSPTVAIPSSFVATTSGPVSFDLLYAEVNGEPAVLSGNLGSIAPTPEPSSFILLGSGLLAAAGVVRRRLAA